MSVSYTDQQKQAIGARNTSLIVSAAAGAGKTMVLVQRVIALLTDPDHPCGVDELLVVTFTNAAAGEMRERISKALHGLLSEHPEDRRLRRQLALLGSARIQTVHSFCQDLIRENFSLCGVDPNFRLADETQCDLLLQSALEGVLEEEYAQKRPDFNALCEDLTDGRTDRALSSAVLEIYQKLRSHPDPKALLDLLPSLCSGGLEDSGWGKDLLRYALRQAEYARSALESIRREVADVPEVDEKYGPTLDEYLAFAQRLTEAIASGWSEAIDCASSFEKGRLPGCRYEDKAFLERVKAARKLFADRIERLRDECFSGSVELALEEGQRTRPMAEALCRMVRALSNSYQQAKHRRGLLDFSDLEHYALAILRGPDGGPSSVASALRRSLREILVDEYQDTNEIQESIFTLLRQAGDSAFFVGDVKQSIYRFRLANPDIFLDRYQRSRPMEQGSEGERRLALNRNFRSRPEVLSLCNFIFRRLMSASFGDVDYDDEQQLYCGREAAGTVPSEVLLVHCPAQEDGEEEERRSILEARTVARRAARILREETVPEGEGLRPARSEDIAILLSSFTNKAPVYRKELLAAGVPCSEGGGAFFGTVEISVMLSLLRVIRNRRQDIPLVSVLRSPFYLFTADRLAALRLKKKNCDLWECILLCEEGSPEAAVRQDLDRWSDAALELPLSRLIRRIYDETGAEGVFSAMDNGTARAANLRRLEQISRAYDSALSGGLGAFLRWIDRKLETGQDLDAPEGESGGVQLMSIHRSKGLEYPFVIVPDLSKPFNTDDLKKPVMFHPYLGIGLRLRDMPTHTERHSRQQDAIIVRTRSELRAEELRKLYVAMTRAREKLILVMSDKNMPARVAKLAEETGGAPDPAWLSQQGNAMSWLISALLTHPAMGGVLRECGVSLPPDEREDPAWLRVTLVSADGDRTEVLSPARTDAAGDAASEPDPALAALMERAKMAYPHLDAAALPSKVTPTGLKKLIPGAGELVGTPETARARSFRDTVLRRPDPKAALRGTAAHILLRHLDADDCADGSAVLRQADALAEKGVLTREMRELILPEPILRYARSPLAQRVKRASRVLREYEFGVLLPAEKLLRTGPEGEELLLNGAIDLLLFEEDGLVLADFKTDRVREGEEAAQAETHRLQMELYTLAAEEIFGLPVRERIVFFLRTGTGVSL